MAHVQNVKLGNMALTVMRHVRRNVKIIFAIETVPAFPVKRFDMVQHAICIAPIQLLTVICVMDNITMTLFVHVVTLILTVMLPANSVNFVSAIASHADTSHVIQQLVHVTKAVRTVGSVINVI